MDEEPMYSVGDRVFVAAVGECRSFVGEVIEVRKNGRGNYSYIVERRDQWLRDEHELCWTKDFSPKLPEVTIAASRRDVREAEFRKKQDARRGSPAPEGGAGEEFVSCATKKSI